jgi:hypothetical protein
MTRSDRVARKVRGHYTFERHAHVGPSKRRAASRIWEELIMAIESVEQLDAQRERLSALGGYL